MQSMQVMKYHIMVWKICGIWHVNNHSILYKLYSLVIYVFYYFFYPLCIALQLFVTDSFNEMIEILLIWPTACAGVKGFFVVMKRNQLLRLFDLLNEMDKMIRTDEHRKILADQLKGALMLVKILSGIYYSTCISSFAVAFLSNGRRFIWASYFPFDYEHNISIYYALLLFQLTATLLVSFIYSSLDVYGSALYRVLGAHVDILGLKLKKLGVREPMNNCDWKEMSEWDWMRKFDADLNECVNYHNYCIQYSTLLNDILSIHFLVQFVTSVLIMCGSEFQLSVLSPSEQFDSFMFTCLYIMSMTYQIFIPCYFGSIVRQKSELLPGYIFDSNWMEQSKVFKSSMVIFGERAKRPITPFAGGLFSVGLPTFVSIMKSAYSLLAFLKNMESKD